MCGRYALYSSEKLKSKFNTNIKKNFNISPNQTVTILNDKKKIKTINWGIKPNWKKTSIINARFETLTAKKSFSNTMKCVFIVDGYYEWRRSGRYKIPFYHFISDDFLYFAGIYDDTGCCIVTTESFNYLSEIHSRQPYFLKENQIDLWLEDSKNPITFDKIVNFHQVSSKVNMIWNNSPDLILEKNC